ncbi:MAG: 3-deoxy-D-manno-octulosonate 8-phosphate phosphatase [Desulfobulbus propionicus]|nr:MAG: 3-deoxy-D-manno-octulosonate 8-phosphate phosphatase [Desulfobulbus propionicus]
MTGSASYPSDCELTEALRTRAEVHNRPVKRSTAWQAALPKAKKIRLLLLDVDGVLTDGTIVYTADGGEAKGFNTLDGLGLRLLADSGVETGLITARTSAMVARRAEDLRMRWVFQGIDDKLKTYEHLLRETGLRPLQTAYMGDDWIDLPLLNRVGLAVAPANSVAEVRQRVDYVSERPGGAGAVRELCTMILEAQGTYAAQLARFNR